MKIALTTHGTRGDVQPFVSLALALMERGHEVTLGAPPNLTGFVERCGVRSSKIAIDSQAFLESDSGRAWLAAGNVSGFMKEMSTVMRLHRDELIDDQIRVSEGADVLVAGVLTEDYVSVLAEARRLPMLAVHFNPLRANGAYANPLVTVRSLPSPLNRLTHQVLDRVWWAGYRDDVNTFRRKLALAPTGRSTPRRFVELGAQTVHAFSPALVPPPREYAESMPVHGSIHFPDAARERLGESARDEGLSAWLGAGPAPVFFGLGSMPVEDPVATLRMVAEVTKACGARALVGAGWSRFEGAAELPAHVRIVGAVDHGWLFPQCAAAVHHGGAGTVFAALRAGLPAVVASVFADQPFWGTRLERLGVGVHLPFRKLRAASLERSLRRVLSPEVKEAARRLGDVLRAEPDATPGIVERIEALGARRSS
jgi:sterol 3beta-glucosyltransferase